MDILLYWAVHYSQVVAIPTFAVDYPGLEELGYIENNAEDDDRDDVEADSLADRAGLGEVPVGVGVADSAVPGAVEYYFWLQNIYLFTG